MSAIESPTAPRAVWVSGTVLVVAATLVLLAAGPLRHQTDRMWVAPAGVREVAERAASMAITVCFAAILAARQGGRVLASGLIALVLAVLGAVLGLGPLRAGVAVLTAVIGGVLAVLLTRPARTILSAVREVVIAGLVAAIGALAVAGYRAHVQPTSFAYTALTVAVIAAFAMVARLGAGLHGLGGRGVLLVIAGLAVLAAMVAYGEALSRWGSPGLVDAVTHARRSTRDVLGALPPPIAALLGFPALTWGVQMRSRRRQGWFACGFGVAATVPITTSLVLLPPLQAVISLGEAALAGVVLGFLLIRLDLRLTGGRGRGTRRVEPDRASRPEPARSASLG